MQTEQLLMQDQPSSSEPASEQPSQPAQATNRILKQQPKRMLEVSQNESGEVLVSINYSSLELLQTCHRKAAYSLLRQLRTDGADSPALSFGSAIHKALECWYKLDPAERELPSTQRERAELYAYGHGLWDQATGALEAIRQFCVSQWTVLSMIPPEDKRSLSNGIKILMKYFKTYADDQLVVAVDSQGMPLVERSFEFELYREPGLVINYHGAIDVVLKNLQSGLFMVADHKTTSSLGSEFYNRCKPNPQYTGYIMGARACLGIETNLFLVNGIQVAKTLHQFARQITTREEEDFHELRLTVVNQTKHWLAALQAQSFCQAAPNPCSMYGGCQYLPVCSVPSQLRESVISAKWSQQMSQ